MEYSQNENEQFIDENYGKCILFQCHLMLCIRLGYGSHVTFPKFHLEQANMLTGKPI